MKGLFLIILICTVSSPIVAQQQIQFEPSTANFTIKNAGLKVHGTVGGLEGFMLLDGQSTDLNKVGGTIDAETIKTGIELRDKHLKKRDYFNVKEYPKIIMTSTSLKKNSKTKYTGNFDLTIKDIKKSIAVPITFSKQGDSYILKGRFSINRLDFKLGEKSLILSDNVDIEMEIKGVAK